MDQRMKVAEAMRDYARQLEDSPDPDVVIAAAEWEKTALEKIDQLKKAKGKGDQ